MTKQWICRALFLRSLFVAFYSAVGLGIFGHFNHADAEEISEKRPLAEDRSSRATAIAKGEINFDDLKFDIQKDGAFEDSMLTDKLKSLDGRNVKLRGYILPSTLFVQRGFKKFVLVRDNQECCFGPGAALFDAVFIEMQPGRTADFVTRPVTVEGIFEIDTETYKYPGGVGPKGATHLAIFRIRGKSVD
ncbi:MAG: DUF3299 domain-containing protein [Planctomycetota bacterium]